MQVQVGNLNIGDNFLFKGMKYKVITGISCSKHYPVAALYLFNNTIYYFQNTTVVDVEETISSSKSKRIKMNQLVSIMSKVVYCSEKQETWKKIHDYICNNIDFSLNDLSMDLPECQHAIVKLIGLGNLMIADQERQLYDKNSENNQSTT